MEASESFYHFDAFDSQFSDPKRNVQPQLFEDHEQSVKLGDLGFCNEESIDLQQYLHLGNTPPNGNGDELLKQFGAYSSSPPVTVNVKSIAPATSSSINTAHTLTKGLAGVSLSTTVSKAQEASVVNAARSSTATTTQLGFQIKQEVDEHSVPEFDYSTEMPPGEEQGMTIVKGDQGNLGGQQYFLQFLRPAGVAHSEDVVTSSMTVQGLPQSGNEQQYTVTVGDVGNATGLDGANETAAETSGAKKRQRQMMDKNSEEYKTKRQRNNVAVRKSREKSKARNKDLQTKVTTLQAENDKLNKKVELLTKELTVLRSLFTTVKPSAASLS